MSLWELGVRWCGGSKRTSLQLPLHVPVVEEGGVDEVPAPSLVVAAQKRRVARALK